MNNAFKSVNDSIVKPFYRENAGFFIFLVFILFGIYPQVGEVIRFHHIIIQDILSKRTYFIAAMALWFLYAIRIIYFFYTYSQKDSYLFLQHLNAIADNKRFRLLLNIQLLLFAPVLVYYLAILIIAINEKKVAGGISVTAGIICLSLLITFSFYFFLQKTKQFSANITRFIPKINFHENLSNFLVRYMFHEQFVAIAWIKTISFCCIYFFITLNGSLFEDRILWFFVVSLMSGHIILIYKNHRFIESRLTFYRSLPVPLFKTILQLFMVYFILLIPEFWALKGIIMIRQNILNYMVMALTCPAMLLLIHSLMYSEDLSMEETLKMLFGIWVVCFFPGLSEFRWLVPVSCFIASVIIFFSCYYRYEKNIKVEGLE